MKKRVHFKFGRINTISIFYQYLHHLPQHLKQTIFPLFICKDSFILKNHSKNMTELEIGHNLPF